MARGETMVIVGASLAGARAADALRDEGFAGRVVLIGEEATLPYERPPLSKSYLRGETPLESAFVFDEAHYASRDIELRLATTATRLDAPGRRLRLSNDEVVEFDRLLLATGERPRRLIAKGSELAGVRYLRQAADADAIRADIGAGPVVIIGAGWIGTEVAASARQLGADVTMVDAATVPLERVLGREVGAQIGRLHEDHGVNVRLGSGVKRLRGSNGHVEEVVLSDGTVLPAAMVVVGVGVLPRVELAEDARLRIDAGVVTDEFLQSSDPAIYAAGDVANAWHPLYGMHLRLEHWSAALNQGPVAARNMLGATVAYDKTPYFFSDQYDLGLEYRGWALQYDEVVFRGDVDAQRYTAFWLREGRVLAAMNVNEWNQVEALDAMVRARPQIEAVRLRDEGIAIEDLGRT